MRKENNKFNILDILIVVLIVFACVYLFAMFMSYKSTTPVKQNIRYVVEADSVQTSLCQNIEVGDNIYLSDGNTSIGKVVSVSLSPVYYIGHSQDGNEVKTEISGVSNVYITLDSVASSTEKGFLIEDTTITIGSKLNLISSKICLDAECISLQIKTLE